MNTIHIKIHKDNRQLPFLVDKRYQRVHTQFYINPLQNYVRQITPLSWIKSY